MGSLVASYNQYWIHPQALSIEINTFGNPNYLQASVSANSVVIAYIPNVIGYAPDGNYRQWTLKAYNTHFTSDSAKYMYLRLDRSTQQTEARIVYSNERLDIYGEPFSASASEDNEGSHFYILLGVLSETDGTTPREWTQDIVTGTLDTSEQRNEDIGSGWKELFSLNPLTGAIDVLKHFTSLIINGSLSAGSAVISGVLQAATGVFNAIRIGGKEIASVRRSTDSPYPADSETSVSTTADVTKNIRSRALIRTADATAEESTVQHSLAVQGNLSATGDAAITGNLDVAEGDVTIGDFQDVSGQIVGAQITHDGFATFANIKALSFQIYELIYNRIRANGGRSAFTGASGVVTAVRVQNAAQHLYRLDLRADEYKLNDKTEFAVGDIFYAYVNHVQNHGYSTGGQCWMHVTEVVTEGNNNYLIAQMYGQPVSGQSYYTNAYTYSGETHHLPVPYNLLPEKDMTITHWGNISNTQRQSTFFIDSNDQNIVQLMNVDEPQISIANYGSIVGRLPSDLADFIEDAGNPINPNQPYFYARGLVVRDLIQMDYQGGIIKTENYRGEWSLTVAQSSHPYANTSSAFDTVTHGDAIWKCEQTGTTAEPGTDGSWTLIQSAQSLTSYKLIPTPNAFSVRADGTVVPSRAISVTVTQVHRGGVSAIATQYELTQLGLRVEYSIGQDGERSVLDIGAADTFDLEDGDPIELENGQAVSLEGEELDTALILAQEGGRGYVYIWLVDVATGIDLDQSTVVFTRDGTAMFRSTVFCRYNPTVLAPTPTTPSGGDYLHPSQVTPSALWHDGVPSGTATLWMSSRIFTSDGNSPQDDAWSEPVIVADTENVDMQFSSRDAYSPITFGGVSIDKNTAFPISSGGVTYNSYDAFMAAVGWVDASEEPEDALWMAVNMKSAGQWLGWVYSRIKGEDGRGVASIQEVYVLATNGTTPSSSASWQTTIPRWQSGKSLWNAMRISYTEGDPTYYDIQNLGEGVGSVEEQYTVVNGLAEPGSDAVWSTTKPTSLSPGQSLWNRERITYISQSATTPDPRPAYTDPSLIGYVGTNGTSFRPIARAIDSSTAPSSPSAGTYWFDTHVTPAIVKRWTGSAWTTVALEEGDAYTLDSNSHLMSWNGEDWADLGRLEGPQGQSVYNSVIFKRSAAQPPAPSAASGSFASPVPSGWSAGIPAGNLPLWTTHRTFTSDGNAPQDASWPVPTMVVDTPDLDVQFSLADTKVSIEADNGSEVTKDTAFPVIFGGHSYATYDAFMAAAGWISEVPEGETVVWMAVNQRRDGQWLGWVYSRIKPDEANGIDIMQERYLLISPDVTDPYAYFLDHIDDSQEAAYYDSDNPDYNLWNALYIAYTDGRDPILYDLENFGAGVKEVTEYYRLTETGETPAFGAGTISQWSTSKADVTAARTSSDHYLWNAERIEYMASDKPVTYTSPALVGYYAVDGVSFNILDNIHSYAYITAQHIETYPGLTYFNFVNDVVSVYQYGNDGEPHAIGSQGMAYRTLDAPLENHLIYHNGTKWIDLGGIVGPKGDPGDDGRPAQKIRLTPELISIPIDPDTRKTLAATSIQFTAQLFYGTEAVAIDSYTVAIQGTGPLIPPTGQAVTITKTKNGNTLAVRINIPKDTVASVATVYVRVSLLNTQHAITGEYADFAMLFVERGKTGPMGSAGPLLYPAGNYDEAVAALADNGYVNDGVTTPYVYFQASGATEGRYYYRTTNGYHYDQQGHLLDPATDYATNQSASAWMLIPQYDAIYTKILFANYANLGKAVFWGPYMFSEYGVRSDGQQVHWSAVEGIDGQQVFDPDTQQLTGDFIPNYYVNLSTGKMHCVDAEIEGVLTETFTAVEDQEDAPQVILMDADAAHNVSVEQHASIKALLLPMRSAVSGIVTDSIPTPVVTASMGGFDKQGVSVRAVNQYAFNLATADQNAEASLLLCADPRMFVPASYTNEATSHYTPVPNVADRDGFFIWNGVAAKFILIPAGYQVRLTMLDTYLPAQNRYVRHWYVDGGADFNAVAMTVEVIPRNGQLCEFGYTANAHRTPTADWLETFLYPAHFLPSTARNPKITIDLYGSEGKEIDTSGFVTS